MKTLKLAANNKVSIPIEPKINRINVTQSDFGYDFETWFDPSLYPDAVIYGNSDYESYGNNRLFNFLFNGCVYYGDFAGDFHNLIHGYDNTYVSIAELVEDYTCLILSETQELKFKLLFILYYYRGKVSDNDFICRAMKIFTGKEYNIVTLRGYCQRDWQYLFYPVEYGKDFVEFIEGLLFTGSEYSIEELDDDGNILECHFNFFYQDVDTIKDIVAEDAGVSVDIVHVYGIEGYTQVANYAEVF